MQAVCVSDSEKADVQDFTDADREPDYASSKKEDIVGADSVDEEPPYSRLAGDNNRGCKRGTEPW